MTARRAFRSASTSPHSSEWFASGTTVQGMPRSRHSSGMRLWALPTQGSAEPVKTIASPSGREKVSSSGV